MPAMLPSRKSSSASRRVLDDALKLKPDHRLKLADLLYASIERDPDVDAAWDREAVRRLDEIRSGRVKPISLDAALKRAFSRRSPRR